MDIIFLVKFDLVFIEWMRCTLRQTNWIMMCQIGHTHLRIEFHLDVVHFHNSILPLTALAYIHVNSSRHDIRLLMCYYLMVADWILVLFCFGIKSQQKNKKNKSKHS